ncbi:hypothetical protein F0L74_25790 [Chitinophaga agrisoli]|uniref:Uncharacterized protein n=1 Tax=Chitinophaga agrisoli TaxID=2607653 RepID=A0A5B2VMU0_9BACT|nr:hypothetical protein [Chitinophaga agrisoli]KAA2239607.1 hypothetical protein F0L74_25790 [Chitinophaga agrisoli]
MSEQILVPIKIEALVVDETTAKDPGYNWKSFYIDYEALASRQGTRLEPADLKELQQGGFCEKGIHLHWALPAALTNGIHKDGKALFPAVPNRWLVIRTHLLNGQPVLKKWLLESDHISDLQSDKSTWAVQNPDGSFSTSHNIGKTTLLDDWAQEQPRSNTPLTAIGPGNASFAAIYQYCRNVFGFWDDLAGVENTATTFSYLVTGWYSDLAIEPLQNADDLLKKNIKSKWQIDGVQNPKNFPTAILCHGFIHSVNWDPAQQYVLPAKGAQVNTGVGLTSLEAKAAQLSRQTGAAEKLLNGYFYDVLKDNVDATEMHTHVDNHTYTAYDGGALWEIKQIEQKDKEHTLPGFPDAAANPGLSAAFKQINTAQQAADRSRQNKRSLLLEFRALTDKIIMASETPDLLATLTAKRDRLRNDIDATTRAITEQEAAVTTQQTLINQMPAFRDKTDFELVQKKMPRYWQPNDPAVLFSGPGITASSKYKDPGNGPQLPCRTAPAIIAGLILNDSPTGTNTTITTGDIPLALKALGSLANNITLISQLYQEAILFDPSWTTIWAQQYYKDQPGNTANIQALAAWLRNMLQLSATAPTDKFKGVRLLDYITIEPATWDHDSLTQLLATRGIQRWHHPWTPIYLVWYAKFIPTYTNSNGQWSYNPENWLWQDKRYHYKGPAPDATNAIEYAGKVLLTDMVTSFLQQRLPEGISPGQHVSQAIGSFSDGLLMRRHSIQLPLLQDPDNNNGALLPDNSLNDYTTREAYFFPDVSATSGNTPNFFPLRAGHLQFTRLWITDAFGQVKKVIDPDNNGEPVGKGYLHIAETLNQLNNGFQLTLAPRVIQPARLSFRWCSAQPGPLEESSNDPLTNPVCGWLLPDFLDQSLEIYETSGVKCGALKLTSLEDRLQLQWNNPPGTANTLTPEQAIHNSYLLGFVNGLLTALDSAGQPDGGNALHALFDLCNRTALFLSTSPGQQAPGLAGLMGQPVALVRASLKLELQGLPAQPQNNEHTITEATKTQPPGLANTAFPIALGDSRNNKDGLIGYFKDNGFEQMHVPFGMQKPASDYFTLEDITLTFNTTEQEAITILMDPRGGVQAHAGVLPVKFIDLPAIHTTGLHHMELDMLIAPFLGAPTAPFVPLGAEPNRQWVLKQQTTTGDWLQTNIDNQTQLQTGALNTQVIQEAYLSLLPPSDNQ